MESYNIKIFKVWKKMSQKDLVAAIYSKGKLVF